MKRRYLWIGAAALALAGCAAEPSPTLRLVRGSAEVEGPAPVWCYSTLADPDCLSRPDLTAQDRLIGAYVPAEDAEF